MVQIWYTTKMLKLATAAKIWIGSPNLPIIEPFSSSSNQVCNSISSENLQRYCLVRDQVWRTRSKIIRCKIESCRMYVRLKVAGCEITSIYVGHVSTLAPKWQELQRISIGKQFHWYLFYSRRINGSSFILMTTVLASESRQNKLCHAKAEIPARMARTLVPRPALFWVPGGSTPTNFCINQSTIPTMAYEPRSQGIFIDDAFSLYCILAFVDLTY